MSECLKYFGDESNTNSKIMLDLLQILKKIIKHYDQTQQLQLLLCVDQLLKNSAFVNDAKSIFTQFIN